MPARTASFSGGTVGSQVFPIGSSGPGSKTATVPPGSTTTYFTGTPGSQTRLASSAWSPASLGSALKIWLDPSDISTITFGAGVNVASYLDKASGVAFAQGTPGNQPDYQAVGINGLGSISFVSANNDRSLSAAAPYIFDGPFSIFFVFQPASVSTGFPAILCGVTSSGGRPAVGYNNANPSALDLARAGAADSASATLKTTVGLAQVHGWISAAGLPNPGTSLTATPYLDGVAGAPLTVAGFFNPVYTGLSLGNTAAVNNPVNGLLGEVFGVQGAVDVTTQGNIQSYLKARWNTP